MRIAIRRYEALHKRLASRHPAALGEAKDLASSVVDPSTASAEEAWRVVWPKPLYANIKVQIANGYERALKAKKMDGAWKEMAKKDGAYAIDRVGKGNSKASFKVRGAKAKKIVEEIHVAPHRQLAIVNAGKAFALRVKRNKKPFSDLTKRSVRENVESLREEFGFGWGHITILHLLTDFGLACKPDIHLVRSITALGLWSGNNLASNAEAISKSEAIEIATIVRTLTQKIKGDCTPRSLREVDKCLMEFSKCGLIGRVSKRRVS